RSHAIDVNRPYLPRASGATTALFIARKHVDARAVHDLSSDLQGTGRRRFFDERCGECRCTIRRKRRRRNRPSKRPVAVKLTWPAASEQVVAAAPCWPALSPFPAQQFVSS